MDIYGLTARQSLSSHAARSACILALRGASAASSSWQRSLVSWHSGGRRTRGKLWKLIRLLTADEGWGNHQKVNDGE